MPKNCWLFAHSIDPLGGPWDQLLRRAPRDSWKHFKGDALSVMSMRETAEILLRFYEDLVEHGAAPALPPLPTRAWHPLTERLSERRQTLDQDLMDAGLSPHYGVVLALEGDTEEIHAPGVLELLGPSNARSWCASWLWAAWTKTPCQQGRWPLRRWLRARTKTASFGG